MRPLSSKSGPSIFLTFSWGQIDTYLPLLLNTSSLSDKGEYVPFLKESTWQKREETGSHSKDPFEVFFDMGGYIAWAVHVSGVVPFSLIRVCSGMSSLGSLSGGEGTRLLSSGGQSLAGSLVLFPVLCWFPGPGFDFFRPSSVPLHGLDRSLQRICPHLQGRCHIGLAVQN